eukprot:GHVU01232052.1.p1 GENE.GHVU01232052.1~~GHVU01232052.1.p1  ORF type:complete len:176 (-),score=5.60 GHVU01232052.1:212-739(-)
MSSSGICRRPDAESLSSSDSLCTGMVIFAYQNMFSITTKKWEKEWNPRRLKSTAGETTENQQNRVRNRWYPKVPFIDAVFYDVYLMASFTASQMIQENNIVFNSRNCATIHTEPSAQVLTHVCALHTVQAVHYALCTETHRPEIAKACALWRERTDTIAKTDTGVSSLNTCASSV